MRLYLRSNLLSLATQRFPRNRDRKSAGTRFPSRKSERKNGAGRIKYTIYVKAIITAAVSPYPTPRPSVLGNRDALRAREMQDDREERRAASRWWTTQGMAQHGALSRFFFYFQA